MVDSLSRIRSWLLATSPWFWVRSPRVLSREALRSLKLGCLSGWPTLRVVFWALVHRSRISLLRWRHKRLNILVIGKCGRLVHHLIVLLSASHKLKWLSLLHASHALVGHEIVLLGLRCSLLLLWCHSWLEWSGRWLGYRPSPSYCFYLFNL